MIIRIVKMTFDSAKTSEFIALFNERKKLIRNFEGCHHLELWQDASDANVYFTYSIWDSEQHLDKYRFSELFKDTWAKTKLLFISKPEAWSVNKQMIVDAN